MNLLLDTHLLLWATITPERLPRSTFDLPANPENELFFSAASIWEVAVKTSLGRADFTIKPALLRDTLLADGYKEIAITGAHALAVATLPPIHKDPFDRILIAQALTEAMLLLTAGAKLAIYPGPIQRI